MLIPSPHGASDSEFANILIAMLRRLGAIGELRRAVFKKSLVPDVQ